MNQEIKKQLSEIFINEDKEIKLSEAISKPTPKKVVKKQPKKQYTKNTKVLKKELEAELQLIQTRGYAECVEEIQNGIASVAVPIKVNNNNNLLSKISDEILINKNSELLVNDLAIRAEEFGAGEIFLNSVDRVASVSLDKKDGVKFNLSKDILDLSVNNTNSGDGKETLNVKFDHDLEISFNSRYLIDVASQLDGERIEIFFNDTGSPALIKDPGDFDSIFVVMPMKG